MNLLYVILLTLLSFQCMVSTIIIIFGNRPNLAIMVLAVFIFLMLFFTNFALRIDHDNYLYLRISEMNIFTYSTKSLIIIIYGFGRCPPGYHSKPLLEHELDEDIDYPVCFRRFYIYVIITLFIQFLVFSIKVYKPNFKLSRTKFSTLPENIVQEQNINMSYKISEFRGDHHGHVLNKDKEVLIFWNDMTYCKNRLFPNKDPNKLLDSISGHFDINSINAVMGPSGAGKTTFIKCLSGVYRRGLTDETTIHINSRSRVKSCFIVQNVSEHLSEKA